MNKNLKLYSLNTFKYIISKIFLLEWTTIINSHTFMVNNNKEEEGRDF